MDQGSPMKDGLLLALVMPAHKGKIEREIGVVMLHKRHGSVHDGS